MTTCASETPTTIERVVTRVEQVRPQAAAEMKTCGPRPRVPEGVDVDPKPGSSYVGALADWGDTCSARLESSWRIIDGAAEGKR